MAVDEDRDFAEAYNCMGLVHLNCTKDVAKGVHFFKSAIDLDPEFTVARENLAQAFLRLTPPAFAEACTQFRVAATRDYVSATTTTSAALCERDAGSEVPGMLLRARTRTSTVIPAGWHFRWGNVLAENGYHDRARHEWRLALRRNPELCPAYLALASSAASLRSSREEFDYCQAFNNCVAKNKAWSDEIPEKLSTQYRRCRKMAGE